MTFQHEQTELDTHYGKGALYVFSWGRHEEDNVLALTVDSPAKRPLVRVQSACYTAEIFRSSDCDCHEQLERSLRLIHAEGGALLYMLCDGRGAGLLVKIKALALASDGIDTADAYTHLGIELDPRRYDRVSECLKFLGLLDIRLMTNNPRKVNGLRQAGIAVEREPLLIQPTPRSFPYLRAKQSKLGHLLDLPE